MVPAAENSARLGQPYCHQEYIWRFWGGHIVGSEHMGAFGGASGIWAGRVGRLIGGVARG